MVPTRARSTERFRKNIMHLAAGLLAAATLTALSATPSSATAVVMPPIVTIYESPGHYTASISDQNAGDGWVLLMFAVGNPGNGFATGATNGWNSASISESDWDNGYPLTPLDFYFGTDDGHLTSEYFPFFADIFGPNANYANTYWLSENFPGPPDYIVIGPNATQSGFTFGNLPASQFISLVINQQGNTLMISGPATPANGPSNVPEPATLALFGFGLAGLGFARRRKAA